MIKVLCFMVTGILISFSTYGQEYPFNYLTERDPMKPLISERGEILVKDSQDVGAIVLQGILYSPDGSTVIIGDEMFEEGDSVGQFVIKEIKPDGIIIEKEDGEEFIKWEGEL